MKPETEIVHSFEEGYPLWGNGNSLQMNYSVTRNKETGALNYTFDFAIDQKTGAILLGITIPVVPTGTQLFSTSSVEFLPNWEFAF